MGGGRIACPPMAELTLALVVGMAVLLGVLVQD